MIRSWLDILRYFQKLYICFTFSVKKAIEMYSNKAIYDEYPLVINVLKCVLLIKWLAFENMHHYSQVPYVATHYIKGHDNGADFLGFLHKSVSHESLALPFEPFRLPTPTPRLAESLVFRLRISPRIRSQNRNGSKCSARDLCRTDLCKNLGKSASLPCPFNLQIYVRVMPQKHTAWNKRISTQARTMCCWPFCSSNTTNCPPDTCWQNLRKIFKFEGIGHFKAHNVRVFKKMYDSKCSKNSMQEDSVTPRTKRRKKKFLGKILFKLFFSRHPCCECSAYCTYMYSHLIPRHVARWFFP